MFFFIKMQKKSFKIKSILFSKHLFRLRFHHLNLAKNWRNAFTPILETKAHKETEKQKMRIDHCLPLVYDSSKFQNRKGREDRENSDKKKEKNLNKNLILFKLFKAWL